MHSSYKLRTFTCPAPTPGSNLAHSSFLCRLLLFSSSLTLLRSPVPSLLAFCISSSWLPSPGCVWRVCNSISCWWRFLRASTPAKSTTICVDTASLHWWWASLQPSTTGAMGPRKRTCEDRPFAPTDWEVGLCYSPLWKCNMQCCESSSCTSLQTGISEHIAKSWQLAFVR